MLPNCALRIIERDEECAATSKSRLPSTTTSAALAAPVARVLGNPLQFRRHLLLRLPEDVHQGLGVLGLVRGEERVRATRRAGTPGTTDTVHVVFNLRGHVVVDHVFDVLHI